MPNSCRWGILSTASIGRKNWLAIHNAENATLVAVASRTTEKAQSFIAECQSQVPLPTVPDAVGSYDALLRRNDIDAVYIPLPTGLRKEWVIKAARAGKHVLCEKPCAYSVEELVEMTDACAANQVQFMDGVMFMHSTRLPALQSVIKGDKEKNREDSTTTSSPGGIGKLKRITAQFTFYAPDEFLQTNIRTDPQLEPLGCLGDLGWYTCRLALWIMKYELPEKVTGRILTTAAPRKNKDACDDNLALPPTEFSGELFFRGGVSATFYTSFITELCQVVSISGTHGYVTMDDFVLPFYGNELAWATNQPHFNIDNCKFHMERHKKEYSVREYSDGKPQAQETNMIRTFSNLVREGKVDDHWPKIAIKTQRVMNACLESARNGSKEVSLVD